MKTFKIPNIISNFIKENNLDDKSFITLINNDSLTPIKIDIKDNIYTVYNLKDNSIVLDNIGDIDDLVKRLFPIDFKLSRILKFQYLLNDIKNSVLTISHPYVFEDKNEGDYELAKKVYIGCFSKTVDENNAYAWWKVYDKYDTLDNGLDNIKVRMLISKIDLLKGILLSMSKDFKYYCGDIDYIDNKKPNIVNKEIIDFFEKSNSFQFEREFRVLVEYTGTTEIPDNKYSDTQYKLFLKLSVDNMLCKNITLEDTLSFNPYKSIECKHKNAVKYLLKEMQDKIQNKKN